MTVALHVLAKMERGAEFVYHQRVGYVGNERVKNARSVLMTLTRGNYIRKIEMGGCEGEYYRIGPEGLQLLNEARK